jgi:predicted PurR-regulated permease PerM
MFLIFVVIGTLVPIIMNYISDTITTVTLWANTAKEMYMTAGIQGFHLHPYLEKTILFLFGEKNIDHTLDIVKQNAGSIQSFLSSQVSHLTSSGISIVSAVGGTITTWLLIAISTFLMILERKNIGRYIKDSLPERKKSTIENAYEKTHHVFHAWIRAMLILSVSIFTITY